MSNIRQAIIWIIADPIHWRYLISNTHYATGLIPSKTPWWRHQVETFSVLLAFVRGSHWSPLDSPHKGQWRGPLMFPLICAWTNGWANNRNTGYLRRHRVHYNVTVMIHELNSGCFGRMDISGGNIYMKCKIFHRRPLDIPVLSALIVYPLRGTQLGTEIWRLTSWIGGW